MTEIIAFLIFIVPICYFGFYKESPLLFLIFIIVSLSVIIIKIVKDKQKAEYEKRWKEEEHQRQIEHKKYEEEQQREIEIRRQQQELERHKLENTKKIKILKNEYNQINTFCENYIIFDLETTGLTAGENEIIEIGAIKYKSGVEISTFHSYIKPTVLIPHNITELTGITDNVVCDAKDAKSVLQDFVKYIQDSVLIAHNSDFDMSFLQTEIYYFFNYTLSNNVIDTLKLSRRFLPNLSNHKLKTIKDYFKLDRKSHNALDDCYITAELYKYCFNKKDNIISPFNADIEFTPFEIQLFEAVKTILKNNNLSVEPLGLHRNSTYTEILYNKSGILTFKLNGKLTYWLVDMDLKTFSEKYGNIEGVKEAPKSQNYKVRVPLNNIISVIGQLDEYIIEEYNKCQENERCYEEWVKRGKPTTYSIMIEFENGKPVKKVYCE